MPVPSGIQTEAILDSPGLPRQRIGSIMTWLLMKKSQHKDRRHREKPQRPFSRPTPPQEDRRPRFSRTLSILYEDDAVVVLDKPSGMLAVPIKGSHTPSAWSLLAERLERKKQQAFIVHRI